MCNSTHGGSGYAKGSYWDGDVIVCGQCGERINNPPPTGTRWIDDDGILSWFGKGRWVPKWPEWIGKNRKVYDELPLL